MAAGNEARFDYLDVNGDERIGRNEWDALDTNRDGVITLREWPWSHCSFDELNTNGDGAITPNEFRVGLRKLTPAEKRPLNRELNKTSRPIHRARHGNRTPAMGRRP